MVLRKVLVKETSLARLRDEAQAENEDFLNKLDENIQKIIKEQVKERVNVQASKILPKIEKTVNEQLEAEVLTRTSNSSKTSYDVAADLSEHELKKILIKKMESKKYIHRSDQQKNLYKALVDAYECDKIILDTYGDTVTLKRRRDDEDKDEEPSVGSDRGSKRRRSGKEPESTSAPKENTSKTSGKYTEGSKSYQKTTSKSAPVEEPMHITQDLEELAHQEFETGATNDQPIAEASRHPKWFQKQAKPPTPNRAWNKTLPATHKMELKFFLEEVYKVTTDQLDWNNPEGQQYLHNLLKPLSLIPNSQGRRVIPFDHFINNNLEYQCGGASSQKYTTSVTKIKAADYRHIKWIEDLVPRTMWSQVPVSYDKYALCGISHWGRKRQQFYGFAINRESARDVYSKQMMASFINSNKAISRGFAFKTLKTCCFFCDDTLNDVWTALDDRLKGIWMKYLPQTIWRRSNKERAAAMIQAIDKQLKTKRIMQSLEKFVGRRLYEGDFRMLQWTI
nr:hypothetical protein [Tanacetum cinerariifolium]